MGTTSKKAFVISFLAISVAFCLHTFSVIIKEKREMERFMLRARG